MYLALLNIYFMGLFNATQLKGNTLKIGAIFGLSEVLGIFAGERLVHYLPQHIAMLLCTSMVLIVSTWIKIGEVSEKMTYALFLIQIFWIGLAFNVLFMY
jgi:hypothetical protein